MQTFLIIVSTVLVVFGLFILPTLIAEYKVAKNNKKFNQDSEVRVIRENTGSGDSFYPQFAYAGEWLYFQEVWGAFYPERSNASYISSEGAKDFIRNRRAELNPEFEVVK
jgi:hypothetical protein